MRLDIIANHKNSIRYSLCVSLLIHIAVASLFTAFAAHSFRLHPEKEVYFVELSKLPDLKAFPHNSKVVTQVSPSASPQQKQVFAGSYQAEQPVKATGEPTSTANPEPPPVPNNQALSKTGTKSSLPAATGGGSITNHSGTSSAVSASSIESSNTVSDEMTFGAASAPTFEQRAVPMYPHMARRFGKEGTAILRLGIDELGNLTGIEVLQDPGYGFAAAAVEAVKRSRFKPAYSNGRPLSTKAILPIRFTLQN